MNGGGIHQYRRARESPALHYSLPLPQGPSAMQLSCEPVLHHALLYPVSARALQQRFPCTTRARTHTQTYILLHFSQHFDTGLHIHMWYLNQRNMHQLFKGSKHFNIPQTIKMSMKTCVSERQCGTDMNLSAGLPSRESQSCWDDGSEGRARALYSKTTELEMIWLLMTTCSVTRPVS